ncbi:hypothetical protein F383_21477 [Gossypium arboreum]|uniref:Uncharacterized protein n=1 Tax=Gossypium arboreum TaxID=29729 RepID=A0A0B0NZ19_GOSAR|nr:hypothetical protein F383_21477 [Gossypium arboreum]
MVLIYMYDCCDVSPVMTCNPVLASNTGEGCYI